MKLDLSFSREPRNIIDCEYMVRKQQCHNSAKWQVTYNNVDDFKYNGWQKEVCDKHLENIISDFYRIKEEE